MKEQKEIIENVEAVETEDKKDEVIETDMAEGSKTEEKAEDTPVSEDVTVNDDDTTENNEEESTEESSETVAHAEVETQIENMNKNDAAKMMVRKAKIIVKESEDQLTECKLLLASDLEHFEEAKKELRENGMDAAEILLTQLGYEAEEKSELDEDIIVFEPKEEVAPIRISEISSGKFSSFIIALIFGFITFIGLVAFATKSVLGFTGFADSLDIKPISLFYSNLIGLGDNVMYGSIVMAAIVFLVMFIVYKIRVSIRASKNLAVASKQLASAEEYTQQKSTCKEQMDKVDAYIHDAIKTLKTFQVVLHEQEAKLERIYHIEHEKIESSDFHPKTNVEMKDTQELINVIKDFMSVPMSEEGKLSGKSSLFLHRAKAKVEKVLERHY